MDISEIKTQSSIVNVADGVQFTVVMDAEDRDDPVSDELMAGNFTLPHLFNLLRQLVPPGGRVIDLGTHVGALSLAAAAAGYDVLSVEASPRNAAMLRASIEANGFTNLNLVHAAISDRPGTLEFSAHGPYGHVAVGGASASTVTVEAITVDELLARAGWERADFVKLDIEGSEVAAIGGMTRLMSRSDAPPLYCESNGHTLDIFGETPQTLKAALIGVGCEIYLDQADRFVRAQPEETQGLTVVDYLAVKSLPAVLASGRVDAGLTPQEQLAGLHASATSAAEPERLYAARTLRDADESFRAQPQAEDVRVLLGQDSSQAVRAIAGVIPSPVTQAETAPKKRSFWAFLGKN